MAWSARGLTLVEIIAASVLGALVAGGTLMGFLLAAKNTRSSVSTVDATGLAQQTLERLRNRIACDDPWFDPATCTMLAPQVGIADPPPGTNPISTFGATRTYDVQEWDCDGDGLDGDCFKVKVVVNWNEPQ